MNKDVGESVVEIDILVTPLLVQDDAVICEIAAGANATDRVKGGVIRLPPHSTYVLRFNLLPGDLPDLNFAENGKDAFWCNMRACPPAAMHNSKNQLGTPVVTNGKTLEVSSTPNNSRNAVHYSLGFDNGCRCDPIIIHDYP